MRLKLSGIRDKRVLAAMEKVPRHEFVPDEYLYAAYEDRPLPIGCGQTISQPYIVALMTELLELKEDDRVLEIGAGSGYQAAILAELVKKRLHSGDHRGTGGQGRENPAGFGL